MSWVDSHRRRNVGRVSAFLAAIALIGCDRPATQTLVSGIVSYRGAPLEHGSLRFYGESNRPISAVLNSDGSYEIELPPGEYRVSVSSPPQAPANSDPKDDTPPRPSPDSVPARFSQVRTSGLKIDVKLQPDPTTWDVDLN